MQHLCLDCGKPIWSSFEQRGDGYVHAECEIKRLRTQRDELLEALRKWVWICDGRKVTAIDWNARWEAAEAATLEAIAACE